MTRSLALAPFLRRHLSRLAVVSGVVVVAVAGTGCEELFNEIVPDFESSLPPPEVFLVPTPSDAAAGSTNEQAACAEGDAAIVELERRIGLLNASLEGDRLLFNQLFKTTAKGVAGVGNYSVEVGDRTLSVQVAQRDDGEAALTAFLDEGGDSREYMTGVYTDDGANGSLLFSIPEAESVSVSWTSEIDGLSIIRLEDTANTLINIGEDRTTVALTSDSLFAAAWDNVGGAGAVITDEEGPNCYDGGTDAGELCEVNCTDELLEGLPDLGDGDT